MELIYCTLFSKQVNSSTQWEEETEQWPWLWGAVRQQECIWCGSDTLPGTISLTSSLKIKIAPCSDSGLQTQSNLLAAFCKLLRTTSLTLRYLPPVCCSAGPNVFRFFFRETEFKFIRIMRSASKPPLISLGALWASPIVFTNLGLWVFRNNANVLKWLCSLLSCIIPAGQRKKCQLSPKSHFANALSPKPENV